MGLFGPSKAEHRAAWQRREAERERLMYANDAVAQQLRLEKAMGKWVFDDSEAGRRKFFAAANALKKLDSKTAKQRIKDHEKRSKKVDERIKQREAARQAAKKKSSWWF